MWVRSPEQMATPWRDLLMAALAAVSLPSAVGLALVGLFGLLHGQMAPEPGLALWVIGTALMLSPMLSLPGMMLALPVVSLLVRLGWFGWLPAAATGLGVGAVIGAMMDFAPAALAGALVLMVLRAVLGRLRPMEAQTI